MRTVAAHLLVVFLAAGGSLMTPSDARAQYFGRNKVQYKTFAFEILRTEHFDIYYYPAEAEAAATVARMAERWHNRLARVLVHELTGRQAVIVYASQPDFRQTNVVEGSLGEGTGGLTEGLRRRIVLPMAPTLRDTDHVLGHELVHAFQYDMVRDAENLPLWFVEGMAEYLSLGPVHAQTAMWLREAAAREDVPSLSKLNNSKYFPYRWGHAFWAYVAGRFGDGIMGEALRSVGGARGADTVVAELVGLERKQLSDDWRAAVLESTGRARGLTEPPAAYGRPLDLGGPHDRPFAIGPALSPDGRRLAFLSARDLLTIDLYVADVASGTITDRVTSGTRDAHLESLQFINSAGAWDATGTKLAFAGLSGGRPEIGIYDVGRGRVVQRLRPHGVDEIFNPAWAPDGRAIAFSGQTAGVTDLFVLPLDSTVPRRLTEDAFADLQPTWAPDGRTLAFVTDRFTSRAVTVEPGVLQPATIDVETRRIERPVDTPGSMTNPQWAGPQALLLVGDEGGGFDLHRLDLPARTLTRLTRLSTGVGGITPLSPAITATADGRRLVFTTHERDGYRLHLVEDATRLAAIDEGATIALAALPPLERTSTTLTAVLADATTGLPEAGGGRIDPYRPRLGLDAVYQPSVGVGVDRYGTYASGSLALLFRDMLGNHALMTAFQATTTIDATFSARDLGALVGYTNLERRWNWGVVAQQAPYRTGFVGTALGTVNGEPAVIEERTIYRQTAQAVSGVTAYPFSEARRVEFGVGAERYTYELDSRVVATSLRTGRELFDERDHTSVLPGLTVGRASAALVFDQAYFGATSPVAGRRSRLEVSPAVGSVTFTGLLADYRRYFMPVPFYTIATRVLHYGRYGGGAEDARLASLFLGYPELVRGYDSGSFAVGECTTTSCFDFSRLLGSRLAVANIELRFPLLRPLGLDRTMYGPVPVELAVFADGGVAWQAGQRPSLFGGDRDGVASGGVSLRANAFGFAIVQLSYVRPFSRPDRGWLWQFSLTQGF